MSLMLAAGLHAQAAAPATITRISGGINGRQPVVVTASKPAHFALFAVGRVFDGNPIQVLSSLPPHAIGSASPALQSRPSPLSAAQLSRFASASEVVVVAFVAEQPPRLDHFVVDGRWANDIVLPDSILADSRQLISTIAEAIYGPDVTYAARVVSVEFLNPKSVALETSAPPGECGSPVSSAPPAGSRLLAIARQSYNPVLPASPTAAVFRRIDARSPEVRGPDGYAIVPVPGCPMLVQKPAPEPLLPLLPTPLVTTLPAAPTGSAPQVRSFTSASRSRSPEGSGTELP
jgi:hypothetical protein